MNDKHGRNRRGKRGEGGICPLRPIYPRFVVIFGSLFFEILSSKFHHLIHEKIEKMCKNRQMLMKN